jgi:hypothetical protein
MPQPGDVALCIYCGGLLRFGPDLVREALTEDDMKELTASNPRLARMLRKAQRIALEVSRHRGPGKPSPKPS